MNKPMYNRITLNFKRGMSDHERAWETLSKADNKINYIVKAILAYDAAQEIASAAIKEIDIRKIVRDELKRANGSTIEAQDDDRDEIQQASESDIIDDETKEKMLKSLDIFRSQ